MKKTHAAMILAIAALLSVPLILLSPPETRYTIRDVALFNDDGRGIAIGMSKDSVVELLGRPGADQDDLLFVDYSNISVSYEYDYDRNMTVDYLHCDKPGWKTSKGITIGSSKSEIIDAYGLDLDSEDASLYGKYCVTIIFFEDPNGKMTRFRIPKNYDVESSTDLLNRWGYMITFSLTYDADRRVRIIDIKQLSDW